MATARRARPLALLRVGDMIRDLSALIAVALALYALALWLPLAAPVALPV